jgi:hypothetical protein
LIADFDCIALHFALSGSESAAMRTFLMLVAALVAVTAATLALPVAVRGDYGHGHGHGGHDGGHHAGGHHAGGHHHGGRHFARHQAPKVKATGKHHHKLKPPKPPKPPKPVKQGGLFHSLKHKH